MAAGPMEERVEHPGVNARSDRNLIGALRRFGEAGPVYEVVGFADDGFVTICLVESGETARYPVAEVRNDPTA